MAERTWTISELSAEFDVTLRSIRFYEDQGLLAPRRDGQTRIFAERDRVRLELILRGKRLGFSLAETAHVLDLYDQSPGEEGQLNYLLDDLRRRREVLQQRRADLDASLAEIQALERRCRRDLQKLRGG